MTELDQIIESNEKILWKGKPEFWPFYFRALITGIICLLIATGVFILFVSSNAVFLLFFPHFWLPLFIGFWSIVYTLFTYRHILYVITNRRVIFQTGLIGRDFKMLDLDQITNAEVDVGILDKLFNKNTGSILLSSPSSITYYRKAAYVKPYHLQNVQDPYSIFKFFKNVSYNIKTDIQFPNAFRPISNPGYSTQYAAKDNEGK